MTLDQAVFLIREHKLNLPERWFSGQEWKDGTAAKVFREDYRRAIKEFDPSLQICDDDLQGTLPL